MIYSEGAGMLTLRVGHDLQRDSPSITKEVIRVTVSILSLPYYE